MARPMSETPGSGIDILNDSTEGQRKGIKDEKSRLNAGTGIAAPERLRARS